MAGLNYTVDATDTQEGFDVIPAGEYVAIIEDSDMVETKNKDGRMLKLTYQIIDGPFKGNKLFNQLNLENKSQQAVQIARKSLNAIGVAVGVAEIKDSSQLHNKPLKIEVVVKDSPEYGKQNQIKKHSALGDGAAPATESKDSEKTEAGKKYQWET